MIKKAFKEAIIMILLLIAIVLVLGVLFYDYIPTGKVVPVIEPYQTSENIKKEINETVDTENTEIIVTYEIDNTDLKNYEKNKDYDKGKENPFADYTKSIDQQPNGNSNNVSNNTTTNSIQNNTTANSNTITNNNVNTNTNSDGTFFNSTKTK